MRKSSLGKRGTSTLPVRKPSLTAMTETSDGAGYKGNCVKSLIPRLSRPRSSSTDRNSAVTNRHAISTPKWATPMQAGLSASVIRNKGLRETSNKNAKDMRPLSDKNFQMLAFQNIYNYFIENDVMDINTVPKTVSASSFTLKLFVTMSNHLFSRIFLNEVITMTNYTEVIPILAREMGYPNTVQKSWLVTANSSHSMPRVIGFLSWLVDAVRTVSDCMLEIMFPCTEQNIEKYSEDYDDTNVISSERFLQHYLKCFEKYNTGQDHVNEEQQLLQDEMNGLKINDNDFKILHNTLSKLEQHLSNQKVVREVEENKELEGAKAKFFNDLTIAEKPLQQKVAYLNELQQKIEERKCRIAKVESTKERQAKNLSEMSEHMKTQEFTPEDIARKEKRCNELDEDIKLEGTSINMWNKENYALDLEMASVREKHNVVCNSHTTFIIKNIDMFPELKDLKVQVNLLEQDATRQLQDIASCRDSYFKKLQIEVQEKEKKNEERKEAVQAEEQNIQELSDKVCQDNKSTENLKEFMVLNDNLKGQKQNDMETLKKLQDKLAEFGLSDCAQEKRMQELIEADRMITEHRQSVHEEAEKISQEIHAMYQEYAQKIGEQVKQLLNY